MTTKGQPRFQIEKDVRGDAAHYQDNAGAQEEQIHSENFKRWFGDWEPTARAKAIKNSFFYIVGAQYLKLILTGWAEVVSRVNDAQALVSWLS